MRARGTYIAAFFASAIMLLGGGAFWWHGRDIARAQHAAISAPIEPPAPPPRLARPKPDNLPYILRRGRLDRTTVALTFDDGPSPHTTRRILAILKQEQVHATFFVIGDYGKRHPDLLKEIHAAGHTLANHSMGHARLTRVDASTLRAQLEDCTEVIRRTTGVKPYYMRPPYGSYNPTVTAEAHKQGLTPVMWGVDPKDYRKPGAGVIRDRVINHARAGSIVLLHEGVDETVEALPEIIAGLRKHGLTFANIDDVAVDVAKQVAAQKAAKLAAEAKAAVEE